MGTSPPENSAISGAIAIHETHLLAGSDEVISLRVTRRGDSRWCAQFSGHAFEISACCSGVEQAYRLAVLWFRRAFPQHRCESACRRQAGARLGWFALGPDRRSEAGR